MATSMGDSYLESGRTSRQRNESDETYNDTINVSERTDYFQDQTIDSQHPSSDAPPQWKIRLNKKSYTQRDVMDTLELRVELATMIKKLIKYAKKEIFEPIRPDLKRFDPRRGFETLAILIPGLVEFINEESTSVMHTYFAGITRFAMYLIEPKDRTEKLLERLLVIATCFGPEGNPRETNSIALACSSDGPSEAFRRPGGPNRSDPSEILQGPR